MARDLFRETIQSGIRPLELFYTKLAQITDSSETMCFRSTVQINSIELGALLPDQYREITNRTTQCVKLAEWNIIKIAQHMRTLPEDAPIGWISMYLPKRMLMRATGLKYILNVMDSLRLDRNDKVCFELSTDILYEDEIRVKQAMEAYESVGFRFALCDFGDEFCPVQRIKHLPVKQVILDSGVNEQLADGMPGAKLTAGYLREMGVDIYNDTNEVLGYGRH